VSRGPVSFVAGDFNRDGCADVVVSSNRVLPADPEGVEVFIGDGLGGLRPGGIFPAANTFGVSLGAVDLNGDGAQDLVYSTASSSEFRVGVLLGNGGGGFGVPRFYFVGAHNTDPRDLILADLNSDGSPEVLSSLRAGHSVSVADGDGSSGFVTARVQTPPPSSPTRRGRSSSATSTATG
jgi:hypothetical protein